MDSTPEAWYEKAKEKLNLTPTGQNFKQEFIFEYERQEDIEIKRNMIYAILYSNMQITEVYLDSMEDMYGNPFNFQGFFEQEKVYDISSIGTIYGMALYFYEKSGTFYNDKEEYLTYRTATGTKIPPNLFTKDPYICLGYDLSSFDSEQAILYSLDNKTYIVRDEIDQNLNKKTIRLRWLHEFENGQIKVVSEASELENYEIRWYRFKMGAPSADEYSGVYWQRINPSETSQFMYVLQPEINTAFEQVKVIILYQGKIIRSNILEFTNEKEVANGATAELLAGLSIWCLDNSYGNYFIYGQNNNLLNESKANEILTLEARFADASILAEEYDIDAESPPLTEAKEITWEFPLKNSMIVVNGFNYEFLYEFSEEIRVNLLDKTGKIQYNKLQELLGENGAYNDSCFKLPGYYNDATIRVINDIIYITRVCDTDGKINNSQDYRINKTYSANKINNTVECSIKKNGLVYSASKDLGFGLMGTNGTDATVVIDFNDNKVALTANDTEEVLKITARLYDYNHQEIDPNNIDLDLQYDWSWEYYLVNGTENNDNILLQQRYTYNTEGDRVLSNETIPINICYLSHLTEIDIKQDYFLVLKVKISGWGDYDLIAYKGIPIRANRNYRYVIGASDIIYNSTGYIDYYKNPYELYYAEKVTEFDTVPSEIEIVQVPADWDIYDPYYKDEKIPNRYIGAIEENTNILHPAAMYFDGVDPYGAICYVNNNKDNPVWIQPLVIMQNHYPSSTINRWDGKSIEINEKEGYIISPAIAAGKKHSNNSFSGVMIGDWSNVESELGGTADDITKQTGIYGFNYGAMSYAFKEDGSAFIGKSGSGRIYFDGNKGKIYSGAYDTIGIGIMIDLDGNNQDPYINIKASDSEIMLKAKKGESQIRFDGSGGHIIISSDENENPLKIGEKFYVEWDGDLHANNAFLTDAFLDNAYLKNAYMSGEVVANKGVIGGWLITDNILQGGTTKFKDFNSLKDSEEAYTWEASQPEIYLDAPHAAICGGNLKPSLTSPDSNRHVMNLWGYLQVCDSDGKPINKGNYFGYIQSGMPGIDDDDGDGIGLSMNKIGAIKLTTSNIGLNYLPGGSYINLHSDGITIEAGTSSSRKLLAMYGSNIKLDNTQLEIIDIAPEQQKGIYARFA